MHEIHEPVITERRPTENRSERPWSGQTAERLGRASLAALLAAAALLIPSLAAGQSQTLPADPAAWNDRLEIGPVAGLTTTWHPAPVATAAPLGATLQFRIRVPRTTAVQWSGAVEVERAGSSIAELTLAAPGLRRVSVRFQDHQGEPVEEEVLLEAVALPVEGIQVGGIDLSVGPVEIDLSRPNASTMGYYFRDESIAPLMEVGNGQYRTTLNRWLTATAQVTPTELAPLVEWRFNGKPQRHLGASVRVRAFTLGENTLSAGPGGAEAAARLDTFLVRISKPDSWKDLSDGELVTLKAETSPPGYEDEVTWLASTKYGSSDPLTGEGPEFTTRFFDTFGPGGSWLGVKAGNAHLGKDHKNPPPANPFDQIGDLWAPAAEAMGFAGADDFGIFPCPKCILDEFPYCCNNGQCVESPALCPLEAGGGLRPETFNVCTDEETLGAAMVVGGFDDRPVETERDVLFTYLDLPQEGDAQNVPPGYYLVRAVNDGVAGLRARFIDRNGQTVAEVPATLTTSPNPTGAVSCIVTFERGFLFVCIHGTCCGDRGCVSFSACLGFRFAVDF